MTELCRISSEALKHQVCKLNEMPLTDDFINLKSSKTRKSFLGDIRIYKCRSCGIVQNPKDFDYSKYYKDYRYSSGHSNFTKNFMKLYAEYLISKYRMVNHTEPKCVLEVGSGDGIQLSFFNQLGMDNLLGIAPSDYLAKKAEGEGISTLIGLFGLGITDEINNKYSICLSSYTFDHVSNPIDYLLAANRVLEMGGILSFEVHDLEQIVRRTEYCLFEHEHTIYLNQKTAQFIVEGCGFELIDLNPLDDTITRGNSLIIVAKKTIETERFKFCKSHRIHEEPLKNVQSNIDEMVHRIERWLVSMPEASEIIGFGAGGRGVMTLAAIAKSYRFSALLDSNYTSGECLTPKSLIPVVGPSDWHKYSQAHCIVFSFGYFDEIRKSLIFNGFDSEKIISLEQFFSS